MAPLDDALTNRQPGIAHNSSGVSNRWDVCPMENDVQDLQATYVRIDSW